MHVPFFDLRLQHASLQAELSSALERVVSSQRFILGPEVDKFEAEIAEYCGSPHAVGVSSGTDAQLAVLMALGIGPGDSVVTTPYTFFATAGCIARLGARPVFADIDPATFNISTQALGRVLASSAPVKAIIPVHLFGRCAEMRQILEFGRDYGVPVLEDAAQALGARHALGLAGALGDAAWFSFYPTKNLGAIGDAGMALCRSDSVADKLRALRNHGMEPRYHHHCIGGNFRLDAIQAAVLSAKLRHLDSWTEKRQAHAAFYHREFTALGLNHIVALPAEPGAFEVSHVYNQFVIRASRRNDLRAFLQERGVGTEIYYPLPLHLQPCFAFLGYREGDFPEAERSARETLALPIFPELKEEELHYVVSQIAEFYGAH